MTTGWERKRSSAGKREGEKKKKKYWKRKARQKLLAQCEHHTFRRPSHCILFLFCANNRWALSLFLSHEWSMPVRSGIVRTPSIYESSHSSPVTMLIFFSLSLFLSPSPLYIFFVFLVIFTTDALIKETSKPKPFTPGNALSFLFRPPLRQPLAISVLSPPPRSLRV